MPYELSRRDFIHRAQRVALATPFLSLLGCSGEEAAGLVSLGGKTMGTTYSVKLAAPPQDLDQTALAREIGDILQTVDRRMSTYRPDSELSRFNVAAAGTWMPVSNDTWAVIDEALRVSRLTDGAFDPTVGPIVDLWGFGPGAGEPRVPPPGEIEAARAFAGFARIETRGDPAAVAKRDSGIRLDLSGVAKGFGVDQVAEHLQARGFGDFLVEVGGELRAGGRGPGGRPWRVGIEKPSEASSDLQRVVDLEREALATSGNYRIFFERDGQRYSHIVDPRSGRPVDHDLASASVVAASAMEADALSTALLVLGADAGMDLARAHGIAAFFVTGGRGGFAQASSPAFEARFKS